MTQAAKKDGASRIFWGEGGPFPSFCPFPSHLLLDLQCPVLGKDWMFVQGGLGEGVSAVPGGQAMGLAGSQDPSPPSLLLHAAREQGLLTPWEPINRKQTPTWCLLPQPGPHHHSPPTALPLAQDLPRLSLAPESQNQEVIISNERTKSS